MQSRKFVAILTGALSTNLLSYYFDVSAVAAAASVALLFAVILLAGRLKSLNDYLPLLYMGTFVGMSNLKSLSLPFVLITLTIACTAALVLSQLLTKRFIGVGGKLGMIAFLAGLPIMFAQNLVSGGVSISPGTNSIALVTTIAVLVLMLSVLLKKAVASPVGVSALLSLLGTLTPYPAIIMAASFAGMSSDQNLSGWRMAAVAMSFASVYSLAFGLIQGVGGWLGFIACVSVFAVVVSERVTNGIRNSFGGAEEAA